MIDFANLNSSRRHLFHRGVIAGSVLLCLLLSLTRLPGMELLGIGPNWLLIWLVTWSLRHSLLQSAIAGLILGLIQDGMTGFYPSHIIGFGCIGFLTAWIGKQRYLQEGLISLLLLVFAMAVVAETATAIQYSLSGMRPLAEIWQEYQRIALSSAILTSLWAPALYYPLNYWWNSKVN